MGIDVRQIVDSDRAAVARILEGCGAFTAEETRVALELFDDASRDREDANGYQAFVAVRDGTVCGYVCIGKTPMTAATWHVYWVCVDAGAQGSGVGRVLQDFAEAFAGSRGAERLVVETSSGNTCHRARHFYDAAGYRQVGRIANYYKANDDCILYCKELAR